METSNISGQSECERHIAMIMGRMLADEGFRARFLREPHSAMDYLGISLTPDECERIQRLNALLMQRDNCSAEGVAISRFLRRVGRSVQA